MATTFRSVTKLADAIEKDPNLLAEVQADPKQALRKLAAPLDTDVLIYRIVVSALGAAVLIALVGAIALSFASSTIPDLLTAIGSAAVGALAGLLAPSPA